MNDRTCEECCRILEPSANGRFCNRCKWAKRARHMCVDCGSPTGWVLTDKRAPEAPRCRSCRAAFQKKLKPCGTVGRYRQGCRCDTCRATKAAELRRFTADYRAKTGHGYRSNFAGHESHWITRAERLAIYERDGWVCQLCYEPVDSSLNPSHRMAATLDHIECQSWVLVPDHSPANLRLAHRSCNSTRGNRVAA